MHGELVWESVGSSLEHGVRVWVARTCRVLVWEPVGSSWEHGGCVWVMRLVTEELGGGWGLLGSMLGSMSLVRSISLGMCGKFCGV